MSKVKAAIIFGGISNEYETSLKTASSVIENIDTEEFETVCIGITKKGRWLYYPGTAEDIKNDKWSENPDCTPVVISPDPNRKCIIKLENGEASFFKVDVVFPLLYGKFGEDGTMAGILRMSDMPVVGSDLTTSAVCMDKTYTRTILGYNKIKTSNWRMMFRNELNDLDKKCAEYESELNYPIVVKPANFRTQKNLILASDFDTLKNAIKLGLAQDGKVVVEEYVTGKELQVAVMGYEHTMVSEPGEVIVRREDFDFNSMFSRTENQVPAEIPADVSERLKEMAVHVYRLLGCTDFARIDFYYTDKDEIILSQVNTVPEIWEGSMFVRLMEKKGYGLTELISELITQAIDNYEARSV